MDSSPPPDPDTPPPEQTFTELFSDLAGEVAALVRHELALAADEMTEKVRFAGRSAIRVVIGVLVGMASLLVLAFALVIVVSNVIPMWLSAFLVAGALGAGGYALFRRGTSALLTMDLLPTVTLASLKEDGAFAQHEIAATREQMAGTIDQVRKRLAPPPKPARRAPAKPAAKRKRAPTRES